MFMVCSFFARRAKKEHTKGENRDLRTSYFLFIVAQGALHCAMMKEWSG
jgi:hypothetical protein